jgi:hypothetical protein
MSSSTGSWARLWLVAFVADQDTYFFHLCSWHSQDRWVTLILLPDLVTPPEFPCCGCALDRVTSSSSCIPGGVSSSWLSSPTKLSLLSSGGSFSSPIVSLISLMSARRSSGWSVCSHVGLVVTLLEPSRPRWCGFTAGPAGSGFSNPDNACQCKLGIPNSPSFLKWSRRGRHASHETVARPILSSGSGPMPRS